MRRKDRAMDREFALKLIDRSQYGVLSTIDEEGKVYTIPLSIVRDGDYLYFHSAKAGKKVDSFQSKPRVNIVFVGDVKVPDNYSKAELDEIVKDRKKLVLLISSVFTTQYESAIVSGRIDLLEEHTDKVHGLRLICQKYTPDKMDYFQGAIEAGIKRTNVYRIKIEEITAKRKRYDSEGKEMKWARMENGENEDI